MRRPIPAIRLRLARIEKKPKSVFVKHWADFAGVKACADLQKELLDIIESIEAGAGAPETCYRAGIDRTPDGLLEQHGIMHLHLGGKESDILVFLIQYADRVVLLETNSHIHFRTQPAGKNLLALSQAWLSSLEHKVAEAMNQAQTATDHAARLAAEEKRTRLAASVAAFKAKAGIT